jgi:hypothetical protein|tara:strand:- start:132 stop:326 length:195 start_codon:yes stop_codon:yes gene_type:complete
MDNLELTFEFVARQYKKNRDTKISIKELKELAEYFMYAYCAKDNVLDMPDLNDELKDFIEINTM